MPFALHASMLACDLQKGITIKAVSRFEDIGPEGSHPYSYSEGDLEFEFRAVGWYDWRISNSTETKDLHSALIAVYIIESTIKPRLAEAKHQSLALEKYEALKKKISDGMLVLCTQGGDYFRFVPDFHLEFVEFEKNVPAQPPRPLSFENLTTYGAFESPLSLRHHRDIGFIYKHSSARDSEKSIEITRISKFEEITFNDQMHYIYMQGNLEFEFRASAYRKWLTKPKTINGRKIVWPHMATYVIEESIEQGLRARGRHLIGDEFQRLIENIREGLWAIETRCGESLHYVPDFRLEFVRSANDAPKSEHRPSR